MHDRAVYPADCNIVLSTVIIVYDGYEGFFEYSWLACQLGRPQPPLYLWSSFLSCSLAINNFQEGHA